MHEDNINKIAKARITVGCDRLVGDLYCPSRPVTRAEMASFLARALDLPEVERDYFVDDDGSVHEDNINKIAEARITVGCDRLVGDLFCPSRPVTRAEMASFLARALDLPEVERDYFVDDDGSVHEDNINKIAEARITVGCDRLVGDLYCPSRPVTRAEMASFLARALDLP